MKPIVNKFHLLMLMIVLLGSSCGGAGDTELADGGGIGGTGVVSSGSIAAIGSIWINGVRFDTSNAEVYVGDSLKGIGDQTIVDNLDPGRIVRVNGRLDPNGNGYAGEVHYAPLLVGPIDAIQDIDPSTMVLSILGQSFVVDSRTFLKDVTIGALSVGNFVEVSGFWVDESNMQATFLIKHAEAASPDSVFRITGLVSGLDPVERTFFINLQKVDYDQADIEGLLPSGIEEGLFVTVSGQLANNGIDFNAAVINKYSRLGDIETQNIEIEGVIGTAFQQNSFTMEGYLVEVTPATEYVGGSTEDLLAGVNVEVEGSYSTGVIFAEKIQFNTVFRAESDLSVKNVPVHGSLSLVGLDGLTIQTNALTRFSGLAANIDQVMAGDHLVIKGWPIDDQTVNAGQVIKLPAIQDKIVLRGIVTRINDPIISVNNVTIDTDLLPDDGFNIAEDMPVSRTDFFSHLLAADWVEIRGTLLPGNSVAWKSITMLPIE